MSRQHKRSHHRQEHPPLFSIMFRTPTRGNFEESPDASYGKRTAWNVWVKMTHCLVGNEIEIKPLLQEEYEENIHQRNGHLFYLILGGTLICL